MMYDFAASFRARITIESEFKIAMAAFAETVLKLLVIVVNISLGVDLGFVMLTPLSRSRHYKR